MDKQGLQAGKSWWHNSNRFRNKAKSKIKPRYKSRKMTSKLELGSRLDWKIVETF